MASWKKLSITAKGAELFARALSERLTFTAIAAGDGLNMSGERESLVNELMRVTPSSVTRDGRIVSVHAAFGPEFNARKITLSEVGVYAKIGEEAEVLVAYGHSTGQGDVIDATASNTNVEKIFNFKFAFSHEANVVLQVPPEAYATNKSVRDIFVNTFGTEDFDKNDTLKIENKSLDVTGNAVDVKTSYFRILRKDDGDAGESGEELFTVTGTTGSDPETCEIKTDETNIASEEVTITAATEEGGGKIALDTDTLEIDADNAFLNLGGYPLIISGPLNIPGEEEQFLINNPKFSVSLVKEALGGGNWRKYVYLVDKAAPPGKSVLFKKGQRGLRIQSYTYGSQKAEITMQSIWFLSYMTSPPEDNRYLIYQYSKTDDSFQLLLALF